MFLISPPNLAKPGYNQELRAAVRATGLGAAPAGFVQAAESLKAIGPHHRGLAGFC